MEPIKVSDCMSKQFVSFRPSMTVPDAATLLVQNELLGGPVVDAEGRLVGWISEQDCIGVVSQAIYYSESVATVAEIMRTDVLTAELDASALDLAKEMQNNKPKVYPIVNAANKVVGVVSRRKILREMCSRIAQAEQV